MTWEIGAVPMICDSCKKQIEVSERFSMRKVTTKHNGVITFMRCEHCQAEWNKRFAANYVQEAK